MIMKAKLFLFVVLCVLTATVNAQSNNADKPFKIGVGGTVGLPVGDYTDWTSMAWGLDALGQYGVSSSLAVTLSAGYLDWIKKSGVTGNWSLIPVLAGVKYDFTDKVYGSAQLGVSFASEAPSGGSSSAFTWAPGVGYKLSDKLDLLLKYQSAKADGGSWGDFLGLRLGYTF